MYEKVTCPSANISAMLLIRRHNMAMRRTGPWSENQQIKQKSRWKTRRKRLDDRQHEFGCIVNAHDTPSAFCDSF